MPRNYDTLITVDTYALDERLATMASEIEELTRRISETEQQVERHDELWQMADRVARMEEEQLANAQRIRDIEAQIGYGSVGTMLERINALEVRIATLEEQTALADRITELEGDFDNALRAYKLLREFAQALLNH